jgi:hypothetical protein
VAIVALLSGRCQTAARPLDNAPRTRYATGRTRPAAE